MKKPLSFSKKHLLHMMQLSVDTIILSIVRRVTFRAGGSIMGAELGITIQTSINGKPVRANRIFGLTVTIGTRIV